MNNLSSDWQIRCPKCNFSKTFAEIGGIRKGAASRGKRMLIWCRQCGWFRWAIVERIPKQNPESED